MIDDRLTVSMQEVFRRIGVMNEKELSDTVLVLMERYRIFFPEEEIVFCLCQEQTLQSDTES